MEIKTILGIDIGSNSVGTAWIDTEDKRIKLGVSVFPAGVEESDTKRGSPKNQKRRQVRSQRRSIRRRAQRKHRLRELLISVGLLPTEPSKLHKLFDLNPWELRREGLQRKLTPHEFGRVLVHLNQRRGALGIETDPDDPEEGRVKDAIDRTRAQMDKLSAETFGSFMADLMDERRHQLNDGSDCHYHDAIRNRRDTFEFHADRDLIREEFLKLWGKQKSFGGELAQLLSDDLRLKLDNPDADDTWRHRGELFGQRRTYWGTGTLGRCDLEPTDHRCPEADMIAQQFRVIESVNNIRIDERGRGERSLTTEERDKVLAMLRKQKNASSATIRRALGIDKKDVKAFYTLNIERDADRKPNTDWFYRSFVHGVFGEKRWSEMQQSERDAINRAILKFDPATAQHLERLRNGAVNWWGLSEADANKLIDAWKTRPKLEKRLSLSRRAMENLLPYMSQFDEDAGRWPTQIEARKRFAEDPHSTATPRQRERYSLGGKRLTKSERQFLAKHPNLLPPPPKLANPVVRKAIYEVRRHVNEYLRLFKRPPDRVVVELARSARQSEKVRNEQLARNRRRNVIREKIIEEFDLHRVSNNQRKRTIERVLLWRQQREVCAYTGDTISRAEVASGTNLEVDHIVPRSRSHDNGMNNKLLAFRDANRKKANRTVKEWLGEGSAEFQKIEQLLGHIGEGKLVEDYFTKKDYARKWKNLHRAAPSTEEFLGSQLTDTAYAARQVANYLRDALFGDQADGSRRVFTTKGSYTAVLRHDWGLLESQVDRLFQRVEVDKGEEEHGERGIARRDEKDRSDHLHHAVDAVAIAFCTGEIIQDLARFAELQEKARAETGRWPRRETLTAPEPWQSVQEFREHVLNEVRGLVVSHRPVKRRIVGALHEETLYGPVIEPLPKHRTESPDTLFTNRISTTNLKPNHLRVPEGWDELSSRLDREELTPSQRKRIRKQLSSLVDPSPAKSGIVRDRELRDQIRRCLRRNDVDPDKFTTNDIRPLIENEKLQMVSGVPIRSVILLRTNTEPVIIARKQWNPETGDKTCDPNPRTRRVHIGGNNHHVEILADQQNGKWTGEFVSTFEAARRVRTEQRAAVDNKDRDGKQFVMSLSEGEMISARRRDRLADAPDAVSYFVVAKLDRTRNRIVFAPHWDARRAAEQDRWEVTPAGLKECEPEPGTPPYKVRVSALGHIRPLHD